MGRAYSSLASLTALAIIFATVDSSYNDNGYGMPPSNIAGAPFRLNTPMRSLSKHAGLNQRPPTPLMAITEETQLRPVGQPGRSSSASARRPSAQGQLSPAGVDRRQKLRAERSVNRDRLTQDLAKMTWEPSLDGSADVRMIRAAPPGQSEPRASRPKSRTSSKTTSYRTLDAPPPLSLDSYGPTQPAFPKWREPEDPEAILHQLNGLSLVRSAFTSRKPADFDIDVTFRRLGPFGKLIDEKQFAMPSQTTIGSCARIVDISPDQLTRFRVIVTGHRDGERRPHFSLKDNQAATVGMVVGGYATPVVEFTPPSTVRVRGSSTDWNAELFVSSLRPLYLSHLLGECLAGSGEDDRTQHWIYFGTMDDHNANANANDDDWKSIPTTPFAPGAFRKLGFIWSLQ